MTNKPTPKKKQEESEESTTPAVPVPGKVNQILQELEIMSLHKGSRGNIDLSEFDKDQKDKLLDLMAKNEDNAIKFHTERTNAIKEIELARIASSGTNNKTLRYVLVGSLFLVVGLTVLILLFKENYFIPWLTFLTGFVGGTGAPRAINSLRKSDKSENPIQSESGE
ncbi:hypothetical protein [Marinoscillum furvescens]|uniref:DUF2335 domain-containing protein n=1 Tax=Marinoscillum furvescens DSM 4134 TaxID=1122208 RepID=A0A3D9KX02_MARFU|nr:hypothetical protein [Marinoscillum furvescens]RED93167.1 hypothetical protein C7460_1266 [Marinoscillum furvescens DSM 4134]